MGEPPPGDSGERGQRDRCGGPTHAAMRSVGRRRAWPRFSRQGRQGLLHLDPHVSHMLQSVPSVFFKAPADQMPCIRWRVRRED